MSHDRLYAVLSGDIVGSSRFMEKGPAIRDAIKSAYADCAEAFVDALEGMPAVDVFAGDSWQVLVKSPAPALRVGLCMRALIKANDDLPEADTRLAIGIGTVEFIDERSASEGQGEAFTLSGEALDSLQNSRARMALGVPERWQNRQDRFDVQTTFNTILVLLDAICGDWTGATSNAMAGALRGWTQSETAEMMGVSQPAISKALRTGHWTAVDEGVRWWEDASDGPTTWL